MHRIRATDLDPLHPDGVEAGERIVVTQDGQARYALVSMADLERLEALEDAEDVAAADEAMADHSEHGGRPWADVKRDLDL